MLATATLVSLLAAPAAAQERFVLDTVYVARFHGETPEAQARADALRAAVEQALSRGFAHVARDDVPPFEDYDAEVYQASCPPGQTLGCAFVVGERAQAEWVVVAAVTPGEGGADVAVSLIDVLGARVVLTFAVPVGPDDDALLGDGVADVLRKVLDGAANESDVRGGPVDPAAQAALAAKRRELALAGLAELERELGAVEKTTGATRIERPRLTAADLAEYRDQDAATPWAQVGLSEAAWLRWRNSGDSLEAWRRAARGREARPQLEAGLGGWSGPYAARYDGRRAVDELAVNVLHADAIEQVVAGGGVGSALAVGLGVLPWLEVGLGARFHTMSYALTLVREVPEEPIDQTGPSATTKGAWSWGPRLTFAPLPARSWRPVLTAGIGFWRAPAVQDVSELPSGLEAMPRPTQVFVDARPGVEIDASRALALFATGHAELRVAGDTLHRYSSGGGFLSATPTAEPVPALGLGALAGVRVRFEPLWRARRPATPDED